jgi:DNA polymerase elongation subunit (family B)
VIFDYIEFKTPVLQNLLNRLKQEIVTTANVSEKDDKFEIKFEIGGIKHTYGLGGLHSENEPEIFIADSKSKLIDSDVTSLYPSIILTNRLYPAHLGEVFLQVYQTIYDQRVTAKKEGRKIENETLKLALNGLTGNLQSPYS